MKSITEASSELDVSRTKIYGLINKLNIKTKKISKNNLIEDIDFDNIKKIILDERNELTMYSSTSGTNKTPNERLKDVLDRDRNILYNKVSDREYTDLKERISFLEKQMKTKDEQLTTKDVQIKEKDYQLNGLIQSNFNLTKSLSSSKTLNIEDELSVTDIDIKKNGEKKSWFKKIFRRS
jgi:hypothetical protein